VAVLDVRPYEDYLAGHIPGAVSINWSKDCCASGSGGVTHLSNADGSMLMSQCMSAPFNERLLF
jgi:rhodanese-related sulfurtransferase